MFEMPVVFHSEGISLSGRFFRSTSDPRIPQPTIVVMGSWLTVKEQMATTYASRFAQLGYTSFVFDFTGFGESHGEPKRAEMPARKIMDIFSAVAFLRTVGFVSREQIGCVAICASAQYMLSALVQGLPIKSFASVAGWFHDPASIWPFYGGDSGVALRLDRARTALERYLKTGELTMAPAYNVGDDHAGIHFRLDYYGQTDRGAIPSWKNEMAEITWLYWLTFDGLAEAERVTTPSLFVHSDGCAFPDHARTIHARVNGPKELVWGEGNQIDFYDQPAQVEFAIDAVDRWFQKTLVTTAS